MNNRRIILFSGLLWLFLAGLIFAKGPAQNKRTALNKTSQIAPVQTLMNLSNWSYWMKNDGQSGTFPFGSASGGIYPRGTAGVIFQDGLVWGGIVNNPRDAQDAGVGLRVGGQTFFIGTVPGVITTPGTPTTAPVGADANSSFIYRIRQDWESLAVGQATVINDAAELNNVSASDVSDAQQQAVIDEYAWAWENWPINLGAPFYDVNENGQYDPGFEDDLNGDGKITIGEREEPGIAGADQVIWFAANDLDRGATTGMYGSPPIGLEMQVTAWCYNQPGATLGQLFFKRFKFINKSGFAIDSMFVSQWCDPDVGNSTDDLVGTDISRSIGFAYTGNLTDDDFDDFNLPPATMGYDFFQGPLVKGKAGQDLNNNGVDDADDFGIFDLRRVGPGFINLPQTSFGFFGAGSPAPDPDDGDYNGTLQWYNLLNGFVATQDTANPSPYIIGQGDQVGQTTKFPLSGDPVNSLGDIDGFGSNPAPGDRRMTLSSGPFSMPVWEDLNGNNLPDFGEPGIQEVTVAVVGGIVAQEGGNNRNAVAQLKLNDDFAQFIFNKLFQGIPSPPPGPKVIATPLENEIALEWGSVLDAVAATEADDPALGFNFEGYNIYQLPTESATKSQALKIATFDKNNNIRQINANQFVPEFGDIVSVPIQKGTDNGIQRHFSIDRDFINGTPLFTGNEYYFAVTAYNAKDENGDGIVDSDVPEASLESALEVIVVTTQSANPGIQMTGELGSILDVTHVQGGSDGVVQATVVDPAAVTGETYEIYYADFATSDSTSELGWNLRKNGTDIVTNMRQAASVDAFGIDKPIIDGLEFIVTGPALDFKDFQVVANASGALSSPVGASADFQGFPGLGRTGIENQQTNGSTWFIHHNDETAGGYGSPTTSGTAAFRLAQYAGGLGEAVSGLAYLIPRDYEIRFTESGSRALYRWPYNDDGTEFMGNVPFELWCIGEDPDDPSDDYQCLAWVNDENSPDGQFGILNLDHAASGGSNDPFTDSFYWIEPIERTQAGYEALLAAHEADPHGASAEVLWAFRTPTAPWNSVPGMMRMTFVNWNGGDVSGGVYDADLPETGTVFRILTSKPNTVADVFQVTAPAIQAVEITRDDIEKINVFPNPYYAFNASETSRFDRFVTFSHLPEKVTVRIFSVSGVQVRKLTEADKEGGVSNQFLQWNLRNEANLPVASGMYIAHIDMPDVGQQKVLKFFIAQGAEILEFF